KKATCARIPSPITRWVALYSVAQLQASSQRCRKNGVKQQYVQPHQGLLARIKPISGLPAPIASTDFGEQKQREGNLQPEQANQEPAPAPGSERADLNIARGQPALGMMGKVD